MRSSRDKAQSGQWRRALPRWGWVVVALGAVVVGGRLLFFEVDGNPLQLPLKARDWTGFGQSYDNDVSVVTEKGTEADGKTTKQIDKSITTQKRLQPAKTFWDWASLLLAPATLAGLGFLFQSSQEKAKRTQEEADKERNADQQRETALQAYLDYLSVLLVDKQLKQFLPKQDKQDKEPTSHDAVQTSQSEAPTTANPQVSDATEVGTPKAEAKIDTDAALEVVKAKTLALFRLFDHADPTDMPRKVSVLAFLGDTGLFEPLKLDLRRSYWSKANLRRAELKGANLFLADLSGADLSHADLSGADLSSADLSDAYLSHADLTGAHLNHANLDGASFECVNLKGAYLNQAYLVGADLTRADLFNANLNGADLTRADLSGANLRGADLRFANLSGANLRFADLVAANLRGADFSSVRLKGAILLGVDLSATERLTQAQLEGDDPPFLCHVTLPQGFTVDPQRNCAELPAELRKCCPNEFKDTEAAQAYLDSFAPKA